MCIIIIVIMEFTVAVVFTSTKSLGGYCSVIRLLLIKLCLFWSSISMAPGLAL